MIFFYLKELKVFFYLCLMILCSAAFSAKEMEFTSISKQSKVFQELYLNSYSYKDTVGNITVDSIVNSLVSSNLEKSKAKFLGCSNDFYWLAFPIENIEGSFDRYILEYSEFYASHITVFKYQNKSGEVQKVSEYFWDSALEDREIAAIHPSFYIDLLKGERATYILKIQFDNKYDTEAGIFSDVILWDPKSFFEKQQSRNLAYGVSMGFASFVALLAFFVFWATRDKAFLYYSMTIVTLFLAMYSRPGVLALHLWQENFSLPLFYFLSGIYFICTAQFVRHYLKTKTLKPRLDKFFLAMLYLGVLSCVAALTKETKLALILLEISGTSFFIYIFAAFFADKKKVPGAILFGVGWSIYSFSVTYCFVLPNHGIVEKSELSMSLVFYSFLVEICLFSLAMAYRVRAIKNEKDSALLVKNEFLSVMGHEIKTPLNAIAGFVGALEEEKLSPGQKEIVGYLESTSQELNYLVNDILDYSKLGEKVINSNELKEFSLIELLSSIIDIHKKSAQLKNLDLLLENQGVPELFLGDMLRLGQLCNALVSNALKYTEEGSVVLEARFENSLLIVSVKDTGIGIEENMLEQVFKPFVKVDSSVVRNSKGVGVGLAIAQKIVHFLQIEISLKSNPGVGSLFELKLPWVPIEKPKEREGLERYEGKRVVVVDDNKMNLKLIERLLQKINVTVESFESGIAAIAWLKENTADLIFMDIQMPEMDGMEASRKIREFRKAEELPIIAVSAEDSSIFTNKILAVGMQEFIAKPVNKKILVLQLNKWL
jgi:two-component system, sensor histidine kinase LadS